MLYLQPNGKIAEPFFNFKSYQEEMIKKNKKWSAAKKEIK